MAGKKQAFTQQYVVLVRIGNTTNPGRYHVHATSEFEARQKTLEAYRGFQKVAIVSVTKS